MLYWAVGQECRAKSGFGDSRIETSDVQGSSRCLTLRHGMETVCFGLRSLGRRTCRIESSEITGRIAEEDA